jgi:hypothetical protein
VIYYQRIWDLVYTPSIAIFGTRNPSDDGIKRAKKLTKGLVDKGFTMEKIANEFLVISQVPFIKYEKQNLRMNSLCVIKQCQHLQKQQLL